MPRTGWQDSAPKKRKVKVTKVVDGHEVEEEIEIEESAGPQWLPRPALRILDHDLMRVDAAEKVTGRARFTYDIKLPGMVYARLLLCPLPRAKFTIDVEPAKKLAGVVAAKVLREEDTLWLGQPLAVVAARTPELAEDALRAIRLEITPLPWAVTREQALAKDAPKVTKDGNVREDGSRGDESEVERAFEECDAVVEGTYSLPVQHHTCLETHGIVVDYRGGDEARVHLSTQAVYGSVGDVAEYLAAKDVEVVCEHMGGGFGSKFGPGLEGKIACELARELKLPVHLMLTRKDEFLMAGNRSGAVQTLKGGATRDGMLVALDARIDKLGGMGRGSHAGQPYTVYKVESAHSAARSVFTNTDQSRAMRAPGHPQASFGMESLIDELAYQLALDPLEMRKRNLKDPVHVRQLERVAQEIGWHDHPHRTAPDLGPGPHKIGIGFGVSVWGGGGRPECKVTVAIARDGSVEARVGSQDLGTGTRTYVAAIVAEELGLEPAQVTAKIGRSSYGPANGSGGSTTTASLAPAVLDGAWKARMQLFEALAEKLGVVPGDLELERGAIRDTKNQKLVPWKDACASMGSGGVSAVGEWQAALAASGVHGAQAAKVQVDVRTGEIRVLDMVCMQDCGLPLNRMAVQSQIQGGLVQALSYGLFEERVIDADLGLALNANLEDYKIAGSLEIPAMKAIIDDEDQRPVIGMSEATIIPGHSAIANAIFNACGVRLREMPLTSDKLILGLEALAAAKKG